MSRRKRGFTLIELLVVMAIISILAAIVVPNVIGWIAQGRMTRAVAEINGIDLALSKMLADTGRNSLNDLFNKGVVWTEVEDRGGLAGPGYVTTQGFERIQKIYTRVAYAMLRDGRAAFTASDNLTVDPEGLPLPYGDYIDDNVQKNLGTSYVPELGLDPWGQLYQIFPGPWARAGGSSPIIFRTYTLSANEQNLPGANRSKPDRFTFPATSPEGVQDTIGFPAPPSKAAFVYSTGQNLISGQVQYKTLPNSLVNAPYNDQVHYPQEGPVNYVQAQEQYLMGGGDDVNNWDSGASWSRFYN